MKIIIGVLGLLSFSTSLWAAADYGCIDGKIRFLEGKTEKVVNERYCYDSLLKKIYSAGRCRPNSKCLADIDKPIPMKSTELAGLKASPGFKICEKQEGIPQLVEYWDGQKWIKTARCIFKDGSYIDNGTLATKVVFTDVPKEAPKKKK